MSSRAPALRRSARPRSARCSTGRSERGLAVDAEPLISTVIPAYNVADTIVATLGSVLGQSHRNLEVLVVDDGSTDDTASLVRSVAAGDDRVRCVDQGGNRGRSAARNFGIDQAVGDWIAFVDADDLWASDRLEAMMAASRDHPRSQVLFDDRLQFTVGAGGAVTLGHRYPTRQMVRTGQVHEVDRRTWMIDRFCRMDPVVRTSLLRDHPIRYPVDLAVGEDLCFYVQLAFWPDDASIADRATQLPLPDGCDAAIRCGGCRMDPLDGDRGRDHRQCRARRVGRAHHAQLGLGDEPG